MIRAVVAGEPSNGEFLYLSVAHIECESRTIVCSTCHLCDYRIFVPALRAVGLTVRTQPENVVKGLLCHAVFTWVKKGLGYLLCAGFQSLGSWPPGSV